MGFRVVIVIVVVLVACRWGEGATTTTPPWIPTMIVVEPTETGVVATSTGTPTRLPTLTPTPTRPPTRTPRPTAVPTPTPTRTPRAATPTATWTPPPNLGLVHVNEAVRGRACPTISVMCPVMVVFIRGDEMILRGNAVIEGEDWLAVDHPSEPGRGRVWIWAAFDYDRWLAEERQAVEYVP